MLLTSLPFALGYAFQGESFRFTGFLFAVEDGNSYIAKMLSGSAGAWSFRTPYTTLPQRGAPVFLPYLLLGKLAAPPGLHEQLVGLYHIFRILSGGMAIFASYDFLALFLEDVRLRRAGSALVALGGGLGWLTALLGRAGWPVSLALEFYSPESFGFLALYGLPHLALARALLLWGFVAYLQTGKGQENADSVRKGTRAGIFWLLASLAQPLAGLLAVCLCGAHLLALAASQARQGGLSLQCGWHNWRNLAIQGVVAGGFIAPWVLVNFLISQGDPFLQSWMAQNVILSPQPLDYLLAYGLFLPFAFSGGVRLVRREPWKGWFPVIWTLALPLLAYAPVNIQRRLVEGVWVAIVCLGLAAVDGYLNDTGLELTRIKAKRRITGLLGCSALLAFPSTAILLAGGFHTAVRPMQPAFLPEDEVAVFEYLESYGMPGAAILSSYETGNALPAWAPAHVVIGHGPESAGLEQLAPRVRDFFSISTPDTKRIELLHATGANYVFWGPAERALGAWDPSSALFLEEVYTKGEYRLFQVVERRITVKRMAPALFCTARYISRQRIHRWYTIIP